MELTIQKRDFLRVLARTHAVADRKSSMPILSNVLLTTEGNDRLRVSATDLYLGVSAVSGATVERAGSVTVAARTLFDIVKALPDGEIHWSVDENRSATLKQGKIKYKMPGLPADDFPPLPNPGDAVFANLKAHVVGDLIAMTSYSMSTDDTRPHLAGTLFEKEGNTIRMVTTDSHRLSKAETVSEGSDDISLSMLVPHKGIGELKRVVEDAKSGKDPEAGNGIEIGMAQGNAFFRRADLLLSVKLSDEKFPPYTKVIPKSNTKRVVALRTKLIDSLKRISLVASDKGSSLQLHIEDGILRIQSRNPEIGEGVEEVEVDYTGPSLSIGFNAKYLLDSLNALAYDEVCLELSGELDPGVIRPVGEGVDFIGVIMPMKI